MSETDNIEAEKEAWWQLKACMERAEIANRLLDAARKKWWFAHERMKNHVTREQAREMFKGECAK